MRRLAPRLLVVLLVSHGASARPHPKPPHQGVISAWGANGTGQLGNGECCRGSAIPVTVKRLTAATQIAAGYKVSLAVLADGTVDSWGGNEYGQLGLGRTSETLKVDVPTPIGTLSGVTQIAATGDSAHVGALLANGEVKMWGSDREGQIGNGQSGCDPNPCKKGAPGLVVATPTPVYGLDGVKQIAVGGDGSYALLSDGTVMGWGNGQTRPAAVAGLSNVSSIAAGGSFPTLDLYALHPDGTVQAVGDNRYGQSNVSQLRAIVSVAAGGLFVLALASDGTVYSLGANIYGELGVLTDERCAHNQTPCSRTPRVVLHGASAISAGLQFGLAVVSGHVEAWGNGGYGQLGRGRDANSATPTRVRRLADVLSVAADENHALASTWPASDGRRAAGPSLLRERGHLLPGPHPAHDSCPPPPRHEHRGEQAQQEEPGVHEERLAEARHRRESLARVRGDERRRQLPPRARRRACT